MADARLSTSWQSDLSALSRTFVAGGCIFALYCGRPVLIPVALATLLTFLLNPAVRALERLGGGRLLSVLIAVSVTGLGVGAIGVVGSRQITSLLSELPENTARITAKVKAFKTVVSGPTEKRFEDMIEAISRELRLSPDHPASGTDPGEPPYSASSQPANSFVVSSEPVPWMMLTGYLGSAVEVLATMAFVMVLLVFFLLEREDLRDRLVLLAGRARLTLSSKALEEATSRVSRYIVMVALVNGGFGLLLTIGLFALGLPYAVLWGALAALLRFIPYFGPWIGASFPIVMSFAMSEGWWQPVAVFGFVMALELITNNIVEPLLFGHTTGVAPTALLISAAFWLWLWGPIGLILSAPFAVCLVVLGKNIPQFRFLSVLLGNQSALTVEVGFYQRLLLNDSHKAALLVNGRMLEPDADQVFDELLLPALNYAKRDYRRGHLTIAERDLVLETLCESFAQVDLYPAVIKTELTSTDGAVEVKRSARQEILCCSATHQEDRIALRMLVKALDPTCWDVSVVSEATLTSELVARVALKPPAVICIAVLPPGGFAQARYLCTKLRAAAPDLSIVVGHWGLKWMGQTDRDRLTESGATVVTTSLQETTKWLDGRRPYLPEFQVAAQEKSLAG